MSRITGLSLSVASPALLLGGWLAASPAWSQERASSPPAAPPPALTDAPEPLDAPAEGEAAGGNEPQRRRSRRAEFAITTLPLGDDRKIELRFDQPSVEDAAYRAIQSPNEGEVVPFIRNRPLKLKTPVDLRFGDVVVAAHNQGPDYPGVYSLWLRSRGGRWFLVFNHLADVWGTQHDAAQDAAEVPLEHANTATPAPTFTAAFEPAEASGGILYLRWGSFEWSAAFTAAPAR
jgi:hypothetical protein